MGRLKIRKYNNDGIGDNQVDYGFPNDGTTENGYNDNSPGIVGGVDQNANQIRCNASVLVKANGTITATTSSATVTGSNTNFNFEAFNTGLAQIWISDGQGGYTSLGVVDAIVDDTELTLADTSNIDVTNSEWYYTVVGSGSIVRQKGSRKFLVAVTNMNMSDESIAIGQSYMIGYPENTDWVALGADPTAGKYDIFTATASGDGLTTDGVAWAVATCVLVDDNQPTGINEMSVAIYDNGDTYYASRLKNKFSTNFDELYDNCNVGTTYSATFFNDTGNTLPDPAAPGDLVYTEAGTENWD